MTKDFADFLESLNREGVAYVVIGGIAVLAHIPYRTTRDLDVLIQPTLDNAEKARRAVAAWGSFEPEYEPADFISGDILSFGGLLRVEIHSRVPGVDWASVWNGRVESELLGVRTSFAGVDELIRMKRATGNAEKGSAGRSATRGRPESRQNRIEGNSRKRCVPQITVNLPVAQPVLPSPG